MFELIHEKDFTTFPKKQLVFDIKKQYSFSIFHPGSYEEYIRGRDLLYIISEKKTNISLSKRSKTKKKRKFNSDNIRRKIKSAFHNSLKNSVEKRLEYNIVQNPFLNI